MSEFNEHLLIYIVNSKDMSEHARFDQIVIKFTYLEMSKNVLL